MREPVLQLLSEPNYQPLDQVEISKKLGLAAEARGELRNLLQALEREGCVARIRKDRYILPQEADLCTGTLRLSRGGKAWIECADGSEVSVPYGGTGIAMHGDRVVARLAEERALERGPRADPPGRRSGRVIRILERANETIVGTLESSKRFFYVVPDDPRLLHKIDVQPDRDELPSVPAVGEKVVARLEEWTTRGDQPGRPHHRGARAARMRRAWICFPSSGSIICPRNFRSRSCARRRASRRR